MGDVYALVNEAKTKTKNKTKTKPHEATRQQAIAKTPAK
jgi:hypothetical protein